MGPPDHDIPGRGVTLSRILKALRRLRGLRPIDVAQAMNMRPRTYEYFESGKAALDVDRVHQVAKILNVDPYAILAAIDIASPEYALRTAENKFNTFWLMALLEFDATAQDDIARLPPAVLIASFTKMFDELLFLAREGQASAEDWMSDKPLQVPPDPQHGNANEAPSDEEAKEDCGEAPEDDQ